MDTIRIDGSMGEGGGQVLRTSLTLAILKQVKVEIFNIRAKRKKPGLLRQHLTCVRAAREICDGTVAGDELGSQSVTFTPGKVQGGEYHFAIGTAGSTSLVCQTVLLPLAIANKESKVVFEGGTHNGMSPSVTFLQDSFLPVLAKMGVKTDTRVEKLGFYPAGGGKWSLRIQPCKSLKAFELESTKTDNRDIADNISVTAIVSQLSENIAVRELATVRKRLNLGEDVGELVNVDTPGPGNTLSIGYQQGGHQSVFEMTGELGTSAETVAKRAVGRFNKFFKSGVVVEEHLADQLLLPIVLAGKGSYTTTRLSLHTITNIEAIGLLTGIEIKSQQVNEQIWRISLNC